MNDPQVFDEFVVAAALEHPAAGRDDFIEQICAGDAVLRSRLAVLLRVRCEPPFWPAAACATSRPMNPVTACV